VSARDFAFGLSAEEVELVLAFRDARAEYGPALKLDDAIEGLTDRVEEEIWHASQQLDIHLWELERIEGQRAAGGALAALCKFLDEAGEATTREIRDGPGRLWGSDWLGSVLRSRPDLFVCVEPHRGRRPARWRRA
jgi:hypothetical protein